MASTSIPGRTATALVLVGLVASLATVAVAGTRKTRIWVAGLDCEGCPASVENSLEALDGVIEVSPFFDQGHVVVEHDDAVLPPTLVAAVVRSGFRAGLDPDRLETPNLLEPYARESDVKVVVFSGEDVDVTRHLAAGKVTVVEFFASWCLPCRAVERKLAELLRAAPASGSASGSGPGLAVRRVNVVDWSTPIAKRYLPEVDGLPFLQVYAPGGKLVAELSGPSTRDIERVITRAGGPPAGGAPAR